MSSTRRFAACSAGRRWHRPPDRVGGLDPVAPVSDAPKFRHEALFYADDDEFLAGTAPQIRDALAAGQPVLVGLRPQKTHLLRAELGEDAEGVRFADMEAIGKNPARLLPVWREFVDANVASARGRDAAVA
jgi:hypothetical protein